MNSKTQTELNKEMHDEACADLTKTNAMLELIKNNSFACEIHIAGMSIGICDNSSLKGALNKHKEEINNFLTGKKNMWE